MKTGKSTAQVAKEIGTHYTTLYRWLTEGAPRPQGKQWTEPEISSLRKWIAVSNKRFRHTNKRLSVDMLVTAFTRQGCFEHVRSHHPNLSDSQVWAELDHEPRFHQAVSRFASSLRFAQHLDSISALVN